MSLTFDDIVDGVLENRFTDNSANRERAEKFVNSRYAMLVALDDWTFRYLTAAVSVTSGTRTVTLPSDFQAALDLWDDDGTPIVYLTPGTFYDVYQGDTTTGDPVHYTILGGVAYVAPTPGASSSAWQLHYRKRAVELSGNDEPIIPAEHRYALIHGGRAAFLAYTQDPSWQIEEQLWTEAIDALRRDYLTDAEGEPMLWAADPTWG